MEEKNNPLPEVAFYWCASCGGCEESIVDLAEDLLEITKKVRIVMWPVAMDFKKKDLQQKEDQSLAVAFINGAVRNSEQEEMAHLLRKKSKIIIAYGSCAHSGGIPALANLTNKKETFQYIFKDSPSTVNPTGTLPETSYVDSQGRNPTLPSHWNKVRSLDQIVKVDYYLPGCPPTVNILKDALDSILNNTLPPLGSVLAPDIALCDECHLKDTKPDSLSFKSFKRPHLVKIDPDKCLLAQEILCFGPATRGGCGAQCITGNMPCSGCFGPTSRVKDQGAKFMSSVSANVDGEEEDEIEKTLETIPDPIGSFYRYSFAHSILGAKK